MVLVLLGVLVTLKTLAEPKLTVDSFPRVSSVRISDFPRGKKENSSDISFDSSEVSFDSSEEFFLSSEELDDFLGSYLGNSSGGIRIIGEGGVIREDF